MPNQPAGISLNRLELDKSRILAVIVSLLADEIKALRYLSAHHVGSERWDASTLIGDVHETYESDQCPIAIGADSMELLSLATRVATFFNIYDSGLEDYLLRFKTIGEWAELVVNARLRGSENLTFATSGSTGTPKQCPQEWNVLVNEALFFAKQLGPDAKQSARRIIALTPCHHIYGFIFSVLLPLQLQLPVIRGPQALALINQRKMQAGDLLIGFPFIWGQLSRQGACFPEGITAITSTGPCDPRLIHQLKQQGLERMIEVYGSSETGGIGMRSDPEEPFRLLTRWQRGSHADSLYECASGSDYELNDQLQWLDQTYFRPAGRRDHAVKVGGINVFPASISERLQSLPEVAAAVVRMMSPLEGERLKAFIVPAEGQDDEVALSVLLQSWCTCNLPVAERPKAFTFGSKLPRSALGKESDWPIQDSASYGSAQSR